MDALLVAKPGHKLVEDPRGVRPGDENGSVVSRAVRKGSKETHMLHLEDGGGEDQA